MALILLEGKTFSDLSGNTYSDPYLIIDDCNGNKKRKEQKFTVEIYKDQEARSSDLNSIYSKDFVVSHDEWDEFFSVGAVQGDNNQYSKAYDYIKQYKETQESDLLYKDWTDLL